MTENLKEIIYPSGDKQYLNENGDLIKTDLGDVIIEHGTKKRIILKK